MNTVTLIAVVCGYLWLSVCLLVVLLALGGLIATAYLHVEFRVQRRWDHWRRFSQRYDARHTPQRVTSSNVRTLPYPPSGGAA